MEVLFLVLALFGIIIFCRSSPISFRWGCGFRPISPGSG